MQCPECSLDFISQKNHQLNIQTCPSCKGMFILQEELKIMENNQDPDTAWLDLELWRHRDQYEAQPSNLACPSCGSCFHTLSYPQTNIHIQICHDCRAVWLNEKMLLNLHHYLEDKITSETIADLIKDFGHEIIEIIKGHEKFKSLGVILKLIHCRVFAEFPFIEKLIENLPKV